MHHFIWLPVYVCFASHLLCNSFPLRQLSSFSFQSETPPTLYLRASPTDAGEERNIYWHNVHYFNANCKESSECQTFVVTDLLLHSNVELLGLIFIHKVYSYLTLLHTHLVFIMMGTFHRLLLLFYCWANDILYPLSPKPQPYKTFFNFF